MTEQKTAFITGIAGQDGAYLAQFLLEQGYAVHGLVRWDSYADPADGLGRLYDLGLEGKIRLHIGDVTDALCVASLLKKIKPDEIYNLAALSQVQVSFETPASTLEINAKGTLAVFESVRLLGMEEQVRIYQASSSEMFGSSPPPQNEDTAFQPCSPYGAAKLSAYWLARIYRESYGMFIANGILFNHESPTRGEDFVTRKITKAAAAMEAGETLTLTLGNLESLRDWGHARDYVRGMWQMLQHSVADDFVLATGEARSVREFVTASLAHVGIALVWTGKGLKETATHAKTGKVLVKVDPQFFRPKDVHHLLGDARKARKILGWKPEIDFNALVADMVNHDRALLRERKEPRQWKQIG